MEGAVAPDGHTVDIILPPSSATPTPVVHDIEIDDDRNQIHPGDAVLLIVEDDVTFARILVDLAHDRDIKVLVALRRATALSLAREFSPRAITLDITLPDMAGWTILDRLKHDPVTRHIPVHVISGDENRADAGWHSRTMKVTSAKVGYQGQPDCRVRCHSSLSRAAYAETPDCGGVRCPPEPVGGSVGRKGRSRH